MRLDTTEQDKQRKLNRSENLRQIPPTDADFKRLYGRRSDAESINRALDDTLWIRRAHSKGAARQSVNLIGFAIVTNAVGHADIWRSDAEFIEQREDLWLSALLG